MKNFIKWVVATLIGAVLFHYILVMAIPYIVMDQIVRGLQKAGTEINTMHHAAPASWKKRGVVKPSPDLLYSVAVYDVSKNPVVIRAKVPDTYWSLSFFQSNLDNYCIINDEQVQSKEVEVIVVGKGKFYRGSEKARVIESPSNTGIILIRTLIEDRKRLNDLMEIQKAASVKGI